VQIFFCATPTTFWLEDAKSSFYNGHVVSFTYYCFLFEDKLNRLNSIFDRIADKTNRGIREDKLMHILPSSCLEQDPVIVSQKYGIDCNVLMVFTKNENYINKKRRRKLRKKNLRILSRGAFLSMFSCETSSFIHSMLLKEKSLRAKNKAKASARFSPVSPERQPRRRASTAPSKTTVPSVIHLSRMGSTDTMDSSSYASDASLSSISSNTSRTRHRRKKSKVQCSNQNFGEMFGKEISSQLVVPAAKITPPRRGDKSIDRHYFKQNEASNRAPYDDGNVCSSFFGKIESTIKGLCPNLMNPQVSAFDHCEDRNMNSYHPSPVQVLRNSQEIAYYLRNAESLDEDIREQESQPCHRRSPSFSLVDSDDEY